MAVNLNFENRTNLYTIQRIQNVLHPCIYSGVDPDWVVRTTHQMGWSYKLGDYSIELADKITSWGKTAFLSVNRTYQQITFANSKGWEGGESDSIYFLLNSNVYIAKYSYEYGQKFYKESDRFLGCGVQLTSLNRGEWISIDLSTTDPDQLWADKLFVFYGRFGVVAKVVPFNYDPATDWESVVPFDVI